MAYYHSDAGACQYQYNQYYCNQYNNYQQQYYAPPQYFYSDGFNCYQVSNGYCFPVAYNSVAGCSEPNRVEWDGGGGVGMDLMIQEVDDGYDDDDFDPTPYGGGYDIVMTYGKPLVASDSICYPRSGDALKERALVASEAVVTVPVDDFQCDNGASDDESVSESCCGSGMSNEDASGGDVVRLSGNGIHDELSSRDGEYEKLMASDDGPIADESSSDAPGFCDGIYGYLPCLNKKKNKTVLSGDGLVDRPDEDPWKAAADFIFGNLNPYADWV